MFMAYTNLFIFSKTKIKNRLILQLRLIRHLKINALWSEMFDSEISSAGNWLSSELEHYLQEHQSEASFIQLGQ